MVRRCLKALAAAVLLWALTVLACDADTERIRIGIAGETFRVEVARTEEQKRQGLMNRKSIGSREGMIFVYGSDQHLAFWMKNTTIPLTLVFLSRDGEILQIEELKPLSLKSVVSERATRYAVELSQGSLEALGVRPGDRVILPEDFP